MVTGVLRDFNYGYYAYQALGETARRWGRSEREARSLYRLMIHLRSFLGDDFRALPIPPGADSFLLEIARIALPKAAFEAQNKPATLVLADCFNGDPSEALATIKKALGERPSACVIAGINRSRKGRALRHSLLENLPDAMVFDGGHSMLLVSRRGLPAQCFPVLFPR